MKNRIIISESQANRLKEFLLENTPERIIVKKIKSELDMGYEPIMNVVRKGGEYFNKPMVKIKADGESIHGKDLVFALQQKLDIRDNDKDVIKQTIIDWVNGLIRPDFSLTKNIVVGK